MYCAQIPYVVTITSFIQTTNDLNLSLSRRLDKNNDMSDKLSSPSISSGTSNARSRSSTGSGDESYLVIRKQPPTYVYSNETFDVEIALDIHKNPMPSSMGSGEIRIVATLHDTKTGRACGEETILITDPSDVVINPSTAGSSTKACAKVRCMIRRDLQIRRDIGVAVELRFTHAPSNSDMNAVVINGVATNPIHLVNYKIRLNMDEDWGKVWYKDEGGRDKSMELFASIYDKDGQLRTGEQIPLLPLLCYDTGDQPVRVNNQDILRTLGSSKIVVDKDTGKAKIRFRVEDVSKNHQGQDFKLEVGPDPKSKIFKDVAVAYTPPVNVRSKRNKRQRKEPGSGRASERRSSPTVTGQSRRSSFEGEGSDGGLGGSDTVRLREAIKGVLGWTDVVVNGLYPLQWQVLGYQQHADGTPDYNRPYHNMPNPNPCISRILSMYSESVRDDLRVLLDAIERAEAPRQGEASYAYPPLTMAPVVPREAEDPYSAMGITPSGLHPQGAPGMPMHAMMSRPGMHPSAASEAFRDKPPSGFPALYQGMPPPQAQPMNAYMRPHPGMMTPPEDGNMMHGHPGEASHRGPPVASPHQQIVPMQRSVRGHPPVGDEESREGDVEYVLAKQYKSLRTGGRLGFPAYSANKELLGFYRESSNKAPGGVGVGQFTPISRHINDFGPLEIMQATEILEQAIAKKSEAVHALKDWGSVGNLLNHALVYDWGKPEIGNDPPPSRSA